MRLSIIADDKTVCISGVCYGGLDLNLLPTNIHAVQWYETFGEIEFKSVLENNQIIKPQNEVITDIAPFMFVEPLWQTAKEAHEVEKALWLAEEEARLARGIVISEPDIVVNETEQEQ